MLLGKISICDAGIYLLGLFYRVKQEICHDALTLDSHFLADVDWLPAAYGDSCIQQTTFFLPTDAYHWGMFMWLAIPASTGAIGLWFAALKIGGSVHTSGFLFLCPLFAALVAFILIGQHPAWHEVIGGVLVGAGLFLMSRQRQPNQRQQKPAPLLDAR
ncbi:MAG TPA: hypothetical protein DEO68_09815 [Halomonas campaniensis]|uniref:EamA domain-containing protein n=1 Tax=Halomonas campaniensis TaxID=213554 RepID=A0A3D0KG01_9GAMM|nr:hypothetical protein [Halomonas campaniensis]